MAKGQPPIRHKRVPSVWLFHPGNAAFNPVLGSGSNRAIQLGLKFIF